MKNIHLSLLLSLLLIFSCGSDEEKDSKPTKKLSEFKYTIELDVSPFENQTIANSDFDYAKKVLERRFTNTKIDEFVVEIDSKNNKLFVGVDQLPDENWLYRIISAHSPVGFYLGYDMRELMTPFIEKMTNPYVWKFRESVIGDDTLFVDTSLVYSELYRKFLPIQAESDYNEVDRLSSLFRFRPQDYRLVLKAILDPDFKKAQEEFPDLKIAVDMTELKLNADFMRCYALKVPFDEEDLITDKNIKSAKHIFDPESGNNFVLLNLDEKGADKFSKITAENIGKVLFIVIGDRVLSSPLIQTAITGGEVQISGNFTKEQAKELESLLTIGAFPFRVEIKGVRESK